MSFFKNEEFRCKCGKCDLGFKDMDPLMISMLIKARVNASIIKSNTVFKLNSAMRCKDHNAKVGGSKTSSHMTGYAVDISVTNSSDRHAVVSGLLEAGFTRLGIGKNIVHVDNDPSKIKNVIWVY